MTPDMPETDLPPVIRHATTGYAWQRQTIGQSSAGVFRLTADSKPPLFLKVEDASAFAELPEEAARLCWLGAQSVPCPAVLAFETRAGSNWLLMSAVAGGDLVSRPLPPQQAITAMAGALRQLHSLDPTACPFDHRLDLRIAAARARMEAGVVDEEDFDDERAGQAARQVFSQLLARRPATEELVVTHGDASMPNFMADDSGFTGFIDCSRLGVADRHQDLSLACWSIEFNLGRQWVAPFLDLYGLRQADSAKLAYYQLLDEFF